MNGILNPDSTTPLYKQVAALLSRQIADQQLRQGDRVPSENLLVQQLKVSRITVRAAIAELVEEGLLERVQGKGTFVRAPKDIYQANDACGFSRSCLIAGKSPRTQLLGLEYLLPPPKVQSFLGLREGERALQSRRLRFADNVPIAIETNFYAQSLTFLAQEDLNGSLFTILQQHGLSVVAQSRWLDIAATSKEEAEWLGVRKGTPLLAFTDQQLDISGAPLFFSKQLYCTDRLKFYL